MKKEITKKQWQTPMIILFDAEDHVQSGKACRNAAEGAAFVGNLGPACYETISGGKTTIFPGYNAASKWANCTRNVQSGYCPATTVVS